MRNTLIKALLGFLLVTPVLSHAGGEDNYDPRWKNEIFPAIQPAPVGGGLEMEGYWVWDGSVIKAEDGKYHMFSSRWPKNYPFHPGWLVASEVIHSVADKPEGPYKFIEVALPARGAQYWDGRMTHNPRILKHKDKYYLFYLGSTHPFPQLENPAKDLTLTSPYTTVARSNKRIGVAWSYSPNGPWHRPDHPVLNTEPDTFYSFLTSNPSPHINEDGSVDLMFKSRAYNKTGKFPFQTDMMIGMAHAPKIEGPYTVTSTDAVFGDHKIGEVEDPFFWKDNTGWHVIAKDQKGKIAGHLHSGILAHSKDGKNWMVDKSPVAYSRDVKWNDGSTITMGQLERAFMLFDGGKPSHLFFATMNGSGGFANGTKSWNMVIPLKK